MTAKLRYKTLITFGYKTFIVSKLVLSFSLMARSVKKALISGSHRFCQYKKFPLLLQ